MMYYEVTLNGEQIQITCEECFANIEQPDALNPFIQRYYRDYEAEITVRLPRNQYGEDIYRFQKRFTDRNRAHKIWLAKKGITPMSLDERLDNGFDIEDTFDISEFIENVEILRAVRVAVDSLSEEECNLVSALIYTDNPVSIRAYALETKKDRRNIKNALDKALDKLRTALKYYK